jgi:ketosteroid isomerase-like protein
MYAEERAVLAANAAFYQAFATRDPQAMDALWARRAPVACIHPGWEALRGREAVMASWQSILSGAGAPPITCNRARAHVFGEMAIVICMEHIPGAHLVATNVFVREDAEWKIVHHQAGGVARQSGTDDDDSEPPTGMLH